MKPLVALLALFLALAYFLALGAEGLIAFEVLRGVAAIAVLLLVSWGLGTAVLAYASRREGTVHAGLVDDGFALVLGLGVLALAGLGLAFVNLYRPWFLALTLALLAPISVWAAWWRRTAATVWPRCELSVASWVALGIAGVWACLGALPPMTWIDALEYQAALPALYLMEGGIVDLPHNLFSHLPHLLNFAYGFALALEPMAPLGLVQWSMGVTLALALVALTERITPGAGLLAAALLYSWREGTLSAMVPGVDLYLAAIGLHALERMLRTKPAIGGVPLAVATAGLTMASKLLGVFVFGGVLLAAATTGKLQTLWVEQRRKLVLALVVALFLPAPLALRTWITSGSPIWPFLDSNPVTVSWRATYVAATRHAGVDGGHLELLPREMVKGFMARSGWNPAVLVGLVGLIVSGLWRRREVLTLAAFMAVVGAGWAMGARVERYALPAAAALAVVAAAGGVAALLAAGGGPARWAWRLALGLPVMGGALAVAIEIDAGRDVMPYLTGQETASTYLERAVPMSPHAILLRANRDLPASARVVSFDDPRLYYLWRPWRASTAFEPPLLRAMVGSGEGPPEVRLWRAIGLAGFTHVLVNPAYVRFMAEQIPGLLDRSSEDQRALDAVLQTHGELLYARNGAALYRLN